MAVKAFGDIGQTVRLRLIRDRFIAGHESCELRRHLDCLPPDTPLRDIVDRCRVWESHSDSSVRRVSKPMPEPAYPAYVVKKSEHDPDPVQTVAVNKPERSVDDSNELLRKLVEILTPVALAGTVSNGQVSATSDGESRYKKTGLSGASRTDKVGNDVTNLFQRKTVAKPAVQTPTGTT